MIRTRHAGRPPPVGCPPRPRAARRRQPQRRGRPGNARPRLRRLFRDSDEASLRRNPLKAHRRGDLRYADRLGDFFSDAYYEAEGPPRAGLAALARDRPDALSATERIAYDVFKWQRGTTCAVCRPICSALTVVRPVDHFNGFHTFFRTSAPAESIAPFKTVEDYENGLGRIDDFVRLLDGSIARSSRAEGGRGPAELVMANVLEQLDAMLAEASKAAASTARSPISPSGAGGRPGAAEGRLCAVDPRPRSGRRYPAARLHRDEYLPRARDGVGLGHEGRRALYRHLVALSTTRRLTPDEIHRIGLAEVARIHAEMEAMKAQVGFTGTLAEFFEHMRTDPQVQAASTARRCARLCCDRQEASTSGSASYSRPSRSAARNPAGAGAYREGGGARLLQGRHAGRLAAGRLLLQRLRSAVADHAGHGDALPPRRRAGAPFPDQPGPGE